MPEICKICGLMSNATKRYRYHYTVDVGGRLEGIFPDTAIMHYAECSECTSDYVDSVLSGKNKQAFKDHIQRHKHLAKHIAKCEDIGDRHLITINAPLARKHVVTVQLISELVDDLVLSEHTPQWLIRITDPAKKGINTAEFKLYKTSVVGIVEFLASLTDLLCASHVDAAAKK